MKRLWSLSLVLSLLTLLSACAAPGPATPAASPDPGQKLTGKLMLYTSVQPEALKQLEPAMRKALPGVELEIFQAGTEKLVAKIAAEMEAGKVNADVLMVADPAYYIALKQKGMLLAHKPAVSSVIGEKDPEGYFTSVRIINTIIGYNTRLVTAENAPKSFRDLTDPKWKGAVAMVDPTQSGSAFDTVAALASKYGWEYFQQLKANGLQVVSGHGALQSKLASGEVKVAILLEMNLLDALHKGDPVQLVYPADGVIMMPSPIGIMKSSQNPEAAKALVNWWYTPEAQGALAGANMHPVVAGQPSPQGARSIDQIQSVAIPMNWGDMAANYDQIKAQFLKVMK